MSMPRTARYMPPQFIRALRSQPRFSLHPTFWSDLHSPINVRERPFDNVLLRYALNMATDKNDDRRSLGRRPSRRPLVACRR